MIFPCIGNTPKNRVHLVGENERTELGFSLKSDERARSCLTKFSRIGKLESEDALMVAGRIATRTFLKTF